jgi:hypothetical protein
MDMSDEKTAESAIAAGGGGDQKAAATEIAYCPFLDIYHYRRVDGEEHLFDGQQLESAVEGYLKASETRMAEFMATLTSLARQFPHKVVSFDQEGNMNLQELVEKKIDASAEDAEEPPK